jgi:protein SCO1/2
VTPNLLPRLFQILTGILLGLAVVLWLLGRPGPGSESPASRFFLQSPLPAPSFSLTAQDGTRISSGDFPDRHLAVFFGYTHCPDVCPLTLSNLTRAFGILPQARERIQVILVTVDPARDTQERLREYLTGFDPSFLGLTGTEGEIRAVAQGFGAFFGPAGEGENYTVDHTARVFVVSPTQEIVLTFPVTATPQEMARDLATLLEETL